MAACMPSSTPRKPGTSRSDIRRVINRGLPGSAASAEYLCGPGLPCGEPPFGSRHVASESEELFNDLLFTLETSAKPAIVEAGEPSSTWSAQAGALMVVTVSTSEGCKRLGVGLWRCSRAPVRTANLAHFEATRNQASTHPRTRAAAALTSLSVSVRFHNASNSPFHSLVLPFSSSRS